MTPNQALLRSAYLHVHGRLAGPTESGMCLSLVRILVEHAFYGGRYSWYSLYRTHRIKRIPGADQDPWARDMERSLREAGMAVEFPSHGRHLQVVGSPRLLPGDILFRWDAAPTSLAAEDPKFIGHVGVLLEGELVLENIAPRHRHTSFHRGVSALTPLAHFPVTTVIRFDPRRPAARPA